MVRGQALIEEGRPEETLFVTTLTGPYRGRKWSLFAGGIRMPFIAGGQVRFRPESKKPQRRSGGVVIHPIPEKTEQDIVSLGTPPKYLAVGNADVVNLEGSLLQPHRSA